MASGAVFKLNCPVVRWDMSSPVVWHGFHIFSYFVPVSCFKNLFNSQLLPHSLSFALCFSVVSLSVFPGYAIRILQKQIWICKCYGKQRSRCVTARTESGQHGHPDMPCMQVKLVYNMAPRGHHTHAQSLNGWIPNSSPGVSRKDHPCRSVRTAADTNMTLPLRDYINSSEFQPPRQLTKMPSGGTGQMFRDEPIHEEKNMTCFLPRNEPVGLVPESERRVLLSCCGCDTVVQSWKWNKSQLTASKTTVSSSARQ